MLKILLGVLGGSLTTFMFILWFILTHYETFEKIISRVYHLFKWLGTYPRKKSIEKDIQGYINDSMIKMQKQGYGENILPYGIRIEWQHVEKEGEVFIEKDEIIIRLGYRTDLIRNFVNALLLYLQESLLPDTRTYLHAPLFESIKFCVALDICEERGREARRYLFDKFYRPLIRKEPQISEYMGRVSSLYEQGLFTSLFLPFLSILGERLMSEGVVPSWDVEEEIKEFLEFLYNIAKKEEYEREKGEEPPLQFIKKYIKIGVVLVARRDKRESFTPHYKRTCMHFEEGAEFVFVMGRGKINIEGVKWISKKLSAEYNQVNGESKFLARVYFEKIQKHRMVEGISYLFERKRS